MKGPSRLFNRNFFLLWQGQFVSQLGSQAFTIAVMFWIKYQTGSATLMGLLMAVTMLPSVILGPIGGTVADRFSRRKIIILSDVLSGIAVLILAYLLYYKHSASNLIIIWLFFVCVVLGVIRSFFTSAISAAIPDIVPKEKTSAANSLNQSSVQISMLAGQGLGGYLFVVFGAPFLILIDGITYLFSAFSESFIKIPQRIPEKSDTWQGKLKQFKDDTIEGFQYVWKHAGIRTLFFAAAFINFFAIPFVVLLPFYVENSLNARADWYGYLLAAFGLGSLIGYTIAGAIKFPANIRSTIVILTLILMSLCFPIFSLLSKALFALILMIIFGILNGFFNINVITILQTTIPSEIRGRIFGLLTTLTSGLMPLSMALAGIVADLLNQNIPLIYSISGMITVVLSVLTSFSKSFRGFLRGEEFTMPLK
jgi:MFS family permease